MADCCACLIADTDAQLSTLETMAARTGFGPIRTGLDAWLEQQADNPPLTFFFFHYRLDEESLGATLGEIRSRSEFNLRFNPVIAVVGECSERDVLRFIDLGFDDIVVLPEAPRVLRRRFTAQLDASITYFETTTYFGPDRRRAVHDPASLSRRSTGPSEHVRYLIRRAPAEGVRVLRRDIFLSGSRHPHIAAPAVAAADLH